MLADDNCLAPAVSTQGTGVQPEQGGPREGRTCSAHVDSIAVPAQTKGACTSIGGSPITAPKSEPVPGCDSVHASLLACVLNARQRLLCTNAEQNVTIDAICGAHSDHLATVLVKRHCQ